MLAQGPWGDVALFPALLVSLHPLPALLQLLLILNRPPACSGAAPSAYATLSS